VSASAIPSASTSRSAFACDIDTYWKQCIRLEAKEVAGLAGARAGDRSLGPPADCYFLNITHVSGCVVQCLYASTLPCPGARLSAWLTLRVCVSGLEARSLPPLMHARKLLQGALLRRWYQRQCQTRILAVRQRMHARRQQPETRLVLTWTCTPDCEAGPRRVAAMRGVRLRAAACALKACRVADDANPSRTVYTPTFSGSAGTGDLGRQTTYNSDGTNTVQNCYTGPGMTPICNGK